MSTHLMNTNMSKLNLASNKPYQPISCIFYDYLEEAATLGQAADISYVDLDGSVISIAGKIKDLQTKNSEEFLVLENGKSIRLDSISEFNGKTPGDVCKI